VQEGSLAVIGGGVIGLSVARRAALDGWAVRVHRSDEYGASWVAGGMLAPHSEGWPGEERLLRLGLASLAMWNQVGAGSYLDGLPERVVTARLRDVPGVERVVADASTNRVQLTGSMSRAEVLAALADTDFVARVLGDPPACAPGP
jgi:glycine oxidase